MHMRRDTPEAVAAADDIAGLIDEGMDGYRRRLHHVVQNVVARKEHEVRELVALTRVSTCHDLEGKPTQASTRNKHALPCTTQHLIGYHTRLNDGHGGPGSPACVCCRT
eukprot:48676-Eustigmatos_ZCMA.PRE.1